VDNDTDSFLRLWVSNNPIALATVLLVSLSKGPCPGEQGPFFCGIGRFPNLSIRVRTARLKWCISCQIPDMGAGGWNLSGVEVPANCPQVYPIQAALVGQGRLIKPRSQSIDDQYTDIERGRRGG